jgi:hypothetical protein
VGAGGSKFCFVLEDGEEKNPKIESKESDVCCENISCCMPKRREAKLGRQRRTQLPTIETYQNMWTNSLPFPAENVMGLEDQSAISSAEADAAAAAAQTASEFFSSCLFIGPCGHVRPTKGICHQNFTRLTQEKLMESIIPKHACWIWQFGRNPADILFTSSCPYKN